jgi:hypothetical protein
VRQTASGTWVAGPGDDSNRIFAHWGDFSPYMVMLNNEMSDQFLFGGLVLDDIGVAQAFDGFESLDDARTFAVESLGVPAARIRVLNG